MSYNTSIYTVEELHNISVNMQKFLEEKPVDQEEGLIDRLELLGILAAKAGKCLADSRWHLDKKKNDSIMIALKDAMEMDWSVSIINKKIDSLCKDENYLVNLFDRINSSAVHSMDALRTVISYRKEQMRMT
jgi:hypothetical protein